MLFDNRTRLNENSRFRVFDLLSDYVETGRVDIVTGYFSASAIAKFFNILSAHYIENRYPEYKKKLSTSLNKHKAEEYLRKTEESYKWIKFLLR